MYGLHLIKYSFSNKISSVLSTKNILLISYASCILYLVFNTSNKIGLI